MRAAAMIHPSVSRGEPVSGDPDASPQVAVGIAAEPPKPPSKQECAVSIANAIASLAASNLAKSSRWFEALLDRAADSRPMPNLAEWRFPRGGWLQIYEDTERAGHGSVTLAVSSIVDAETRVRGLGIDTGEQTSGAAVKTFTITDPDGNRITFAEALDQSMAR